LGEFLIQKARCRAHVDFLFLGLKRFTQSVAGPATGRTLVAIIPLALSAYTQCRLLNLKKYNGGMHRVNPFLSSVSFFSDQRCPMVATRIVSNAMGHP
jgi:hypothetical protein